MDNVFSSCQQAPGSAQIKYIGLLSSGPTTCRRSHRIWVSKDDSRKQSLGTLTLFSLELALGTQNLISVVWKEPELV